MADISRIFFTDELPFSEVSEITLGPPAMTGSSFGGGRSQLLVASAPIETSGPSGHEIQIIPSFCASQCGAYEFRFALSSRQAPMMFILDAIGGDSILTSDLYDLRENRKYDVIEDPNVDFFSVPRYSYILTLCVRTSFPLLFGELKTILAVTVIDRQVEPFYSDGAGATARPLNVPLISQFADGRVIGPRICSATNVAMVLQFYQGRELDLMDIANLTYSARRDSYGLWPRSIWAASRYGIRGAVTALKNWTEVAEILHAGTPIIASITYGAGELTNSAVLSTRGHLVTIVGLSPNSVIVNDPAGRDRNEVRREYDLTEFSRAWFLNKAGVCYILQRPSDVI